MTSGGTGNLYGSYWTDAIGGGSANDAHGGVTNTLPGPNAFNTANIDTVAVTQLGYQASFLQSIAWQNLKPDTGHAVVTSGFGSCPTSGLMASVTCVTDAADSLSAGAATLAVAYLPGPSGLQTITVNLASFSGGVTARWFDPTNGQYTSISGSPFANSGTHNFTPPSANSAGENDWVLLLQG